MKHLRQFKETILPDSEGIRCKHCGDQLLLKNGEWPFWLSQAVKNGFQDAHRDCKAGEKCPRIICESLTHARH